jgi:galactose mutarotase-like enzyme
VKDSEGREYLWQAGPEWPRHSPILFPLVCSVNDNTYRVDGKEYHLPRHGFARDKVFTLVSQTQDKVTFALHDSEETLEVYPYHFNLAVTYRLEGNRVNVIWHVENTDTCEIHFQIGGHPAFNVPGGKLEGMIKLDNEEPMDVLKSYADGSHDMVEVPLEADMGILEINNNFFRNDSVKIHKSQTHRAMLLDTNGEPAVTVDYKTPVCAFWSPFDKQAPFVCIEPWYGIGDPRGFQGEFKDKPLMNHLLPGTSFMSKYVITIG